MHVSDNYYDSFIGKNYGGSIITQVYKKFLINRNVMMVKIKCFCGNTFERHLHGKALKSKDINCGCLLNAHRASKKEDYLGKKFFDNLILDVFVVEKGGKKFSTATAKCRCGKMFTDSLCRISKGYRKGCGCGKSKGSLSRKGKKRNPDKISYKHKMANKCSEYIVWKSMRQRCNNPNNKSYKHYGGRGIKVCERWSEQGKGFLNFYADMGERPDKNYSIDRIDNNKGYNPENCRWSTIKTQARNKRSNKYLVIEGETKTYSEWCEIYKVDIRLFHARKKNGWSDLDSLKGKEKEKKKK